MVETTSTDCLNQSLVSEIFWGTNSKIETWEKSALATWVRQNVSKDTGQEKDFLEKFCLKGWSMNSALCRCFRNCCCLTVAVWLKTFLIKIAAKNYIEAHKGNKIRTVTWGFVRGREQKKSLAKEDSKNGSFLWSKWIMQPLASTFHLIPHRKCLLSLWME